jgi:hypothetical protein
MNICSQSHGETFITIVGKEGPGIEVVMIESRYWVRELVDAKLQLQRIDRDLIRSNINVERHSQVCAGICCDIGIQV